MNEWMNKKTTLYQYLSVFDVVTKQSFTRHLSNQLQKVKWVYWHCSFAVSNVHGLV